MASATLKIDIWTDGDGELPFDKSDLAERFAPHAEHVAEMCAQGYMSGEIIDDEFHGWWTIEHTEAA